MNFIMSQIIGGIGLLFLVYSLQKNNRKKLLKYQVLSSFSFALQYFLLGAYSGGFMHFMCMVRNHLFSKYKKGSVPFMLLLTILLIIVILSLISYVGFISLLPMMAVVMYSCALWYGNLTYIRIIEVIGCTLFVIYSIYVVSISGVIASLVEISSALVAIFRFDLKKKKKRR